MGMPFLAGVGVAEGDDRKVEEAVREFTIARSHLRDARSGLYYHAWDEAKKQNWADPETGRSRFIWGRGLGWYAMALVDIDVIPPEKTELQSRPRDDSRAGREPVRHRDATGVWCRSWTCPASPELPSSSGHVPTSAKAVNKGYLHESFMPAARRAWAGLVDGFSPSMPTGRTT
jgi:rhamnogalacturonyl hydrolase YesR